MIRAVIDSREDMERLVMRAKAGDSLAFKSLFEHFYSPLYRYIYTRSKIKEDVPDLVANVFLKFYEALPRYEEGSIKAYLYTIAIRLIINNEGRATYDLLSDDAPVADDSQDIEYESELSILKNLLLEAVETLKPFEKDVILLYFFADLNHEEISLALGLNEANIRKIKSRALASLRVRVAHLETHGKEN